MPVPDFQSLMLPVLEVLGTGAELSSPEIREGVASRLGLTEDDRIVRIPSGRATVFANRCAWATIHMERAGLLQRVKRGVYRIAERGNALLKKAPPSISMQTLAQYAEYRAWRASSAEESEDSVAGPTVTGATAPAETPELQMDAAYRQLRIALEEDLLSNLLRMSWQRFESVVVELLVRMGYGGTVEEAGRRLGKTGDDGLDGVISEDRLGFDVIYVQAKKWQPTKTVGRPDVQQFAGSLEGARARKGVFITTSRFAETAVEYVQRIEKKIVLMDGRQLARHMADLGLGVTTEKTYDIGRVDADFFADE